MQKESKKLLVTFVKNLININNEIHYKPYRILFEINNDIIYVHSVLDGRRNVQEILSNRILR